jgi:hypothetical protein
LLEAVNEPLHDVALSVSIPVKGRIWDFSSTLVGMTALILRSLRYRRIVGLL